MSRTELRYWATVSLRSAPATGTKPDSVTTAGSVPGSLPGPPGPEPGGALPTRLPWHCVSARHNSVSALRATTDDIDAGDEPDIAPRAWCPTNWTWIHLNRSTTAML